MSQPAIDLTDSPDPDEVAQIATGLNGFNDEHAGKYDHQPLAVLARDPETGRLIGGLTGWTSLGVLFVDMFHLPAELRGQGIGSQILRQAEDEARRRGCKGGVLYTISFQAPGFYERNGWRAFGEIPCDPPGTSRVFMTKELL